MHRMDVIQTSGLPHSDIPGSWDTGSSPGLFAAGHVLLRLAAPRHPPWTLISLDHIVFLVPFANRFQKTSLEARGFEPLTLGLQSRCSSQLSYAPSAFEHMMSKGKREKRKSTRPLRFWWVLPPPDNVLSLRRRTVRSSPASPFFPERR